MRPHFRAPLLQKLIFNRRMDVPAKHVRIWSERVLVEQYWVMTHYNETPIVSDLFVVLYVLEHIPKLGRHTLKVVVAPYEHLVAFELREQAFPLRFFTLAEISKDICGVTVLDGTVPVLNEPRLHSFDAGEWAVVELDYVGVTEMQVGYVAVHKNHLLSYFVSNKVTLYNQV